MKVYRLRHKPTGLFYTPSRGSGNLSKKGKAYVDRKPDVKWALCIRIQIRSWKKEPKGHHKILHDYFGFEWNDGFVDISFKTQEKDWEIIEIN